LPSVTFHGAAREVTGSCHLVEASGLGRVLLDCGMHQGGDAVDRVGGKSFPFEPGTVDAVILSHAHLDHSGMLPKLFRAGFAGPVYCTPATAELLYIMLEDAWGLYERDLEFENRKRKRKGRKPTAPDYTHEDVEAVLKSCEAVPYETETSIADGAILCFHDAGHILGSAIVELHINENGNAKSLVFSGDLGNPDSVLMNDPYQPRQADLVMMEGTYGNRDHRDMGNTLSELEEIIERSAERGGNVMIPSFAVGRAQEILYHLGCLYHTGKLDGWTVFLDSPMATEVTRVYDHWLEIMDHNDVLELTEHGRESLTKFLPTLHISQSAEESMAINDVERGAIIIAGSGMCTGGRIRHHFKHRIWDSRNTILFIGFQAEGSLGRLLVDGKRRIRMFGDEFAVKAEIATLGGFSAHAGQSQLIDWATGFEPAPLIALVHGEALALQTIASKLQKDHGVECVIPSKGSRLEF